jgi:hypothetical protein
MKEYQSLNQTEGLEAIIARIVRLIDPEKIFLLSASYEYQLTESIFRKDMEQGFRLSSFDLLALSEEKDELAMKRQAILTCRGVGGHQNLHLSIVNMDVFNEAVKKGHEYENYILQHAMIWYDRGRFQLAQPSS